MQISVVIPLYNKKDSVLRAMNSVCIQKLTPLEIIVVNDGSTDGSERVVAELDHPLIRLVHQDNGGVSASRNKGIELAKGEWIAFLDADDYWDANFLQKMAALHSNYPEAKILASNYRYQNYQGVLSNTRINNLHFSDKKEGILHNYFEVAATSSPPLWSSALLINKKALVKIGCFPLGIQSGEDLITWAKLAIQNTIAYTIEPLSTFVLAPAHSYNDKPNRIPETPDFVGVELQRLLLENPKVKSLGLYLSHWHKMRASIYLRLGKKSMALVEILKTVNHNPLQFKAYVYLGLLILPVKWTLIVFKKLA
jgi:glycosyltransferase involved in cell wall biosynthesis